MYKFLRCSLCFQLQLSRNSILGWGRKNICTTPWSKWMAAVGYRDLRDAPVKPRNGHNAVSCSKEGEITLTDCTAKKSLCRDSQKRLFFLISTLRWQGWVSADCQHHLHPPNSEEGRGSRAKGEPDHPLSAGKCCRGRLPNCVWARLGNAHGPGDIFIRKEENPGQQS